MTDRRPAKNGRKAFKGMGPKGYRIRMMEPGEVPALMAIENEGSQSVGSARPAPDIHAFTRFLLANEVFVAVEKTTAQIAGFAAAVAESDLYWLSRLAVSSNHREAELEDALLKAATERAHWFFYRALGLSIDRALPRVAPFYEKRGFLAVPASDLPEWLDEKRRAEASDPEAGNQIVMLKWL